MDVDVKKVLSRLDELIALAGSRSRDVSIIVQVEAGTNSVLKALDEHVSREHRDYLEKKREIYSREGMMPVYVGVLTSIKRDIEMGLVANLPRESEGEGLVYEFSDNDLNRIQTLINELRDWIGKSKCFEEEHRQRLLRKLEKLQAELHKKIRNLDRFWGLFVDAGIAVGKFGEAVKPMVERIQEIADIVFKVQSAAEKVKGLLPMRLLPESSDKSESGKS